MYNKEKLYKIIQSYKEYLPKHWKDEKYKWEAVKYFQNQWNINALDFAEMLEKATEKTLNLLASMHSYPRGMMIEFAKVEPDTVRAMFMNLYDEKKSLQERIDSFMFESERIRLEHDNGNWKNHYQNLNTISTYLWLRYPEKYYIYKYSECRRFALEIESAIVPKKGTIAATLVQVYKLYDTVTDELLKDKELEKLFQTMSSSIYVVDKNMRTLLADIVFFTSRFYNREDGIDIDNLSSDARIIKWFSPVIEALKALGGSARRPEVHEEIIKRYNISKEEINEMNKSNTSKVLNDIDWARNYMVYEGFLSKEKKGIWELTDLAYRVKMTEELAGKIFAKWVRIKAAQRKHTLVPEIDLEPYYVYEEQDDKIVKYTEEQFLSEVFISEDDYNTLWMLLQNKKNLILQGAPGVGKTFTAKRLAYAMLGYKDDEHIEFIQFHQNYSYEDFIMGYKPNGDGFELKEGIFYKFCCKAESHPDEKYFFIIDEINRGNMSKIFGELLMMIEKDYRGTKTTLAYTGESFTVPKNLYLIGMMNTADRSLAMIDYALRRRFSFFEMEPGFKSVGFQNYQENLGDDIFDELIAAICELNKKIASDSSLGKGFQIGHSYFCNQEICSEEWMKGIVYYDIIPMLKEYWFDDKNEVQYWENRLAEVFDD